VYHDYALYKFTIDIDIDIDTPVDSNAHIIAMKLVKLKI